MREGDSMTFDVVAYGANVWCFFVSNRINQGGFFFCVKFVVEIWPVFMGETEF